MVVICRKLGGDTGCTPGERHYLTSRKINSFGRNFCEVTDLFTIDDVGGHQVNHITNRPQEALILQAVLVDFEAPPFLPRVRDAIFLSLTISAASTIPVCLTSAIWGWSFR